MTIQHPYLLFLGDAPDQWRRKPPMAWPCGGANGAWGSFAIRDCKADLGLPDMTLEEAGGGRGEGPW